jgi:hypothetical protein
VKLYGFCVDLHSFCGESCEATVSKLLILLNGLKADCEATAAKLLILLESCVTACFSGLIGAAWGCRGRGDAGEWRRARDWLFFVMIPVRSFSIEVYIDCAPGRGN